MMFSKNAVLSLVAAAMAASTVNATVCPVDPEFSFYLRRV
jgi:hypothetical protein